MPDPAPMAAILTKLIRTHNHEVYLFNKWHTGNGACKKVLSQLIPEKCYKSLSSRIIGFAKIHKSSYFDSPCHQVRGTGRRWHPRNWLENERADFRRDHIWRFYRKNECNQKAVAVQNPYTPPHIVSMAYANIEKCGLYQDDFREWSQTPRLEKIWRNFKAHFARVFKETRRSSRTSKTKGYASNVRSVQSNAALFTEMQQDHTMALANLAIATQADRTLVAMLTKTIAELSTQVSTLTAKLATAQSDNACLKISGYRSAQANHGHRMDNVQAPSDQNPPHDCNVYSRRRQKFYPKGYCSSHGFEVEKSHTSATCRYPVDGHNKLMTRPDTTRGKTWNKDWINSRPTEWGGAVLDNNWLILMKIILITLIIILNLYIKWMN